MIFLVAFITMLLLQKTILQWNSSCYEESNLHAPNCQVQLTLFVAQFTQLLGSFCMVECSVLLDTLIFFDFRISPLLILFLLWFLLCSLWYFILLDLVITLEFITAQSWSILSLFIVSGCGDINKMHFQCPPALGKSGKILKIHI